jgi:glycosyltransferase involved in cell wall biosynthesis
VASPTVERSSLGTLAARLITCESATQPPLLPRRSGELTMAIASLALGGAERIVLDWAARLGPPWRAHLIVLRDDRQEWPVPHGVRLTRLHGREVRETLRRLGRELAQSSHPVCLCHLLTRPERQALATGGAVPVPVLHNARAGWIEEADELRDTGHVLTVSRACADDLRATGWRGSISTIRYTPAARRHSLTARSEFRRAWNIPDDAWVVGMIGGVKPQKNYTLALAILAALSGHPAAHLVIVGGPTGRNGRVAWNEILETIHALGVRSRVALPGAIEDAARCLPAFDVFLNTSHYEGLSIATLEALEAGLPVVASGVGGQQEIEHPALTLVDAERPPVEWASALLAARTPERVPVAGAVFPSHRLWTLASLASPPPQSQRLLFVTANLNAGGAQRSLVHITKALARRFPLEVLVTGTSTASAFFEELAAPGVTVHRTALGREPFDHTEALVASIARHGARRVCFWNVDPKIKLLAVKTLGHLVRFVDVSPGPSSFTELAACAPFQRLIDFDSDAYVEGLDRLVLKYNGAYPATARQRTAVIPNGVARNPPQRSALASPRIVVSGRIAPTKHLVEVIRAMPSVWRQVPEATLHVFGAAEPRHELYLHKVLAAAIGEVDQRIFFHGPRFDMASILADFAVCVVLGEDQGCPNAILEALAAGVPVVGNDDGGTRELVHTGHTGLLLPDCEPDRLAAALLEVLTHPQQAARWGERGRRLVTRRFSLPAMTARYARLLAPSSLDRAFGWIFTPRMRSPQEVASWSAPAATVSAASNALSSASAGRAAVHNARDDWAGSTPTPQPWPPPSVSEPSSRRRSPR